MDRNGHDVRAAEPAGDAAGLVPGQVSCREFLDGTCGYSMRQDPHRADPYYWAAFAVTGDASPLPRESVQVRRTKHK